MEVVKEKVAEVDADVFTWKRMEWERAREQERAGEREREDLLVLLGRCVWCSFFFFFILIADGDGLSF